MLSPDELDYYKKFEPKEIAHQMSILEQSIGFKMLRSIILNEINKRYYTIINSEEIKQEDIVREQSRIIGLTRVIDYPIGVRYQSQSQRSNEGAPTPGETPIPES